MRIDVVSLFPEFIAQCAAFGVVGRAQERGLLSLHGWNPRDYADGNYRRVDDRPFGGGPGMVMLIDPLRACLQAARAADPAPARVDLPQPAGRAADPGQGARTGRPRAPDPAVRPLRGRRRAPDRSRGRRGAVDRRLRAVRRRTGGGGGDRCGRPAAGGRAERRRIGGPGQFRGRPAGLPALHPSGRA